MVLNSTLEFWVEGDDADRATFDLFIEEDGQRRPHRTRPLLTQEGGSWHYQLFPDAGLVPDTSYSIDLVGWYGEVLDTYRFEVGDRYHPIANWERFDGARWWLDVNAVLPPEQRGNRRVPLLTLRADESGIRNVELSYFSTGTERWYVCSGEHVLTHTYDPPFLGTSDIGPSPFGAVPALTDERFLDRLEIRCALGKDPVRLLDCSVNGFTPFGLLEPDDPPDEACPHDPTLRCVFADWQDVPAVQTWIERPNPFESEECDE